MPPGAFPPPVPVLLGLFAPRPMKEWYVEGPFPSFPWPYSRVLLKYGVGAGLLAAQCQASLLLILALPG